MFDGHWRAPIERGVKPLGAALRSAGVTADHLTATGVCLSAVTAVVIGSGRLGLGFWLLVLSTLPDVLDGAVAKASGSSSQRGAFFDSVADRVTDTFVLGGLAWYLAGESPHTALLPFAVLGVSTLVSYERAKAESLGLEAKGGLMERAERIIAIAAGLVFSTLLVPILWVMLALTTVTAVQRFVKVWKQADAPPPRPARRERRTRQRIRWSEPVSERWRRARSRA